MPRNRRPALLPLAAAATAREEDEGTWMLTFSDLVLLLLAFVALGILMERSRGPHVVTDRLHASAPPAEPLRDEPFALVEDTPPAVDSAPASVETAHLRRLARRLETRVAAEGIPGIRPIVVDATGITIEVGSSTPAFHAAPIQLGVTPESVTIVEQRPTLGTSSTRDRALARTVRLAHEVVAGDPLLTVHAVRPRAGEATPARIQIGHAG